MQKRVEKIVEILQDIGEDLEEMGGARDVEEAEAGQARKRAEPDAGRNDYLRRYVKDWYEKNAFRDPTVD